MISTKKSYQPFRFDISPMIGITKPYKLFRFDHCDFVNDESLVRHHMSIANKPFQCEYCNLKNMFCDIMKTHIQSNHKNVPSTHIIYSLFKYPLKKKDFAYAHPRMIQSVLNVS